MRAQGIPGRIDTPGLIDGAIARLTRVLVVVDDGSARQTLVDYLEQHDMTVTSASQGQDVLGQFRAVEPNVVILDLRLGHDNGLDLLRAIRSRYDVPVIITADHRHDETDRVVGLELGADDYVTKPFGIRELVARIRAVLRRRKADRSAPQREAEQCRYRFGNWQLDRRLRRLTSSSGTVVALTKGEYSLLVAFIEAPQRPLTREHLLQVTRVHEDVFDRSIDVQILRLRRKLETDPRVPRIIQTERGVGYTLALPVCVEGRVPFGGVGAVV
jgi:two-component system OmpR family response regulator